MKLKYICLFIIGVFSSCNDCHLVDCAVGVGFDIQIVDKLTLNSLLKEPDSLYHVDEMSITSLVDGEEIVGQLFRSNLGINDSLPIQCWSNVAPDMMFLKLNKDDTDTLSFVSELIEGECCDFYRLDSVSINGGSFLPVLNSTVRLLK